MKNQRLKFIIVTATIFTVALVSTGLFVREIIHQSSILMSQVIALQKDQAQQTQLAKLKKLITASEESRTTLSSHYLESQSDSIDFLNYIEQLAADQGVDLETKNVADIERGKTQLLTVQYNIVGSLPQLERFVELLEKIPYVSELTTLQLKKRTAVSWDANITIEVIVLES